MIKFIIGFILGSNLGVIIFALIIAGKQSKGG